jgi:SAM-dependent methyltransferase
LLPYLTEGTYEGFDIIKIFVTWLQKNFTPKNTNFRFQHSNIFNSAYNPDGKIKAAEYYFPHPDNSFDLVYLESVFTHMLPKDLEHYLLEIVRVLKPNGFCSISYFLLYPERSKIQNDIRMKFYETKDVYQVSNLKVPEAAVAYPREYILSHYQKLSLETTKLFYGDLQDVIIARKQSP